MRTQNWRKVTLSTPKVRKEIACFSENLSLGKFIDDDRGDVG